jgi:hypothetical protein
MSETSEYSYELCGPDPTEDLYWLRQRGRPVIRRCCGGRLPGSESAPTPQSLSGGAARAWRQRPALSQSWIVHAPHVQEQPIYLPKLSRRADMLTRARRKPVKTHMKQSTIDYRRLEECARKRLGLTTVENLQNYYR